MKSLKVAIVPMLLPKNQSVFQTGYQRFMVPLGPLYLASYLESLHLPIDILVHDQIETVLNFKPDVVGFSCVSENFGYAQSIAIQLKKKMSPFTLIGGPHFTSLPRFLPDCFDVGVVGEGEIALAKIIQVFLQKDISKKHLKKIPGLVMKEEGQIIHQGRAVQVEDLNSLPLPNRKQWVYNLGVPHIMTTRGCVYRCFFCAEPTIFKSFRASSALRIVEEIENILINFPNTKHIRFYDDIFPVNKKRMRELCNLFIEKKIPQKVSFSCFIHANLVDEEIVDLLKKMGFIFVQFGADSGSGNVLKTIKPNSTVDLNQRAIDLFYEKGIRVGLSFVVGTPKETPTDLQQTYDFIVKNREKVFDVEINPAVTLPGTDLWNYAIEKNLIPDLETIDWNIFRDAAHLVEFDLNRYIYVAAQIPTPFFVSMLKSMWNLNLEIQKLHDTENFYKENYLAGYRPVLFRNPPRDEHKKTSHLKLKRPLRFAL